MVKYAMDVITKFCRKRRNKKREKERKERYKFLEDFIITITFQSVHHYQTLRNKVRIFTTSKLSADSKSLKRKIVKVQILTKEKLYPATLTLSDTIRTEIKAKTDFSPINYFEEENNSLCQTLEIPETLYQHEIMEPFFPYPTRSAASSDSVLSSDGSLISVFNTAAAPSPSSATYTNLETSLDLPIGDTELLQQYINDPSSITDFEFDEDIFKLLHEPSLLDTLSDLTTNETMTIQPNLNQNTEATNQIEDQIEVCSPLVHHPSVSSVSCMSDDFESSDSYPASTKKTSKSGSFARFGNKKVVKYSDEYHERRIKNNMAVKTSRMKAKERQQSNDTKMVQLVEENRSLNDRVDTLTKELEILKSLYSQLRPDFANGNGRQLPKAKKN